MTPGEIAVIVNSHEGWLKGQPGAKRANLSLAQLSGYQFAETKLRLRTH